MKKSVQSLVRKPFFAFSTNSNFTPAKLPDLKWDFGEL